MKQPQFVVLIVIDCLRADHLRCYGYARDTSPTIDFLAALGVRFDSCYPQGIYTFPAHISLLTSIHHVSHQLKNGDLFTYNVKTIADYLKDAGYTTAAFVSNGMLAGDLGLRDRFDFYDDGPWSHLHCEENSKRTAQETTQAVLNWLGKNKSKKTFLFIHFNDCHAPYIVPHPYSQLFVDDDLYHSMQKRLPIRPGPEAINPKWAIGDRQDVNFYISQYDAAIRYVDEHIGRIYECLTNDVSIEDLLMIITGDHGEAMGEHGIYFTHGKGFYEEFLRVPLIIAGGTIPRGRSLNEPVRHIDILPTVLELLNYAQLPEYVQGTSLLPLLTRADGLRWCVDLFDVQGSSAYIREGNWKYLVSNDYSLIHPRQGIAEVKRRISALFSRPREELYNLRQDPAEKFNLVAEEKARAHELRRMLESLIKKYRSINLEVIESTGLHYADEDQIKDRLRALGYID